MPNREFSRLNPRRFLQTFVSQSVEIGEARGCEGCSSGCGSYIEQLGLAASAFFEDAYRNEYSLEGSLERETYVQLIVALKNRIGGNFSRASGEADVIRVVSTRCPFGSPVKEAPSLCQMTSSVFGGIAARNFGYAKVVLEKRIAVGDDCCQVSVYLDPQRAANLVGEEYRSLHGEVVSGSGDSEIAARIAERLLRAWRESGDDKPTTGARPVLVANSPAMLNALETIEVVAPTTASVLIAGETGVGKELIAKAVHALSFRANKPFIAVNCGAIPDNLIESMLFGHERGAFTGAYEVHHGFFERAEAGTLFLDEIDSLPVAAQVRLLRVLQGGEFERVGGKQELRADVRIVAASSRPLKQLVEEGKFRHDLFYRLSVVPIPIPPLRERREEILPLVEHFLGRLAKRYGKAVAKVADPVMAELLAYDWPGNVRELENALERSFLFARGPVLTRIWLGEQEYAGDPEGELEEGAQPLRDARKRAADKVESVILKENLKRFGGNVSAVAKALHLTPRAVHQKLSSHRIDPGVYRGRAGNEFQPKADSRPA